MILKPAQYGVMISGKKVEQAFAYIGTALFPFFLIG